MNAAGEPTTLNDYFALCQQGRGLPVEAFDEVAALEADALTGWAASDGGTVERL